MHSFSNEDMIFFSKIPLFPGRYLAVEKTHLSRRFKTRTAEKSEFLMAVYINNRQEKCVFSMVFPLIEKVLLSPLITMDLYILYTFFLISL